MEFVPCVFRKDFLKIVLGLDDIFSPGQTPALGKAVNMGVYGKGRLAKTLRHHHAGGFMSHTRQRFKRCKVFWNQIAILIDKDFGES